MKFSVLIGFSLMLLGVALLTGCRSIGPATVAEDRYDYSNAITDSWKRQSLLNIVKLRYLDPPTYMDVGQIVAGYQMEYTAGFNAEWHRRASVDSFISPQIGAHYTDRPTITYTPLTGSKFIAGIATPVTPMAIFATIQSGWPADVILALCSNSINGLHNENISTGNYMPPDAGFSETLHLMRELQKSGILTIRMNKKDEKDQTSSLVIRADGVSASDLEKIASLRRLLHLTPDITEYKLVYRSGPPTDTEIAIQTRSILHVTGALSLHVEVPDEDIASGRVLPGHIPEEARRIHFYCSKEKPNDAFVAVPYRKHWYWVDDKDLRTKQIFSFLMLLFTMASTSGEGTAPVLTISTN